MKKTYSMPEIKKLVSYTEDIMNGSDVEIDVSELFDEVYQNN